VGKELAMKTLLAACLFSVIIAGAGAADAVLVNGSTAQLDMRATITCQDGLVLTFVSGHGMNGADAYVYTDVGGVVEEDSQYLGTWQDDTSSWYASASTSHGAADGSVTVNTPGFDYSIHGDAMVEGLALGDYGLAQGDAYGWPDWLRNDHAGTARITIEYTFTLDTRDTCDDATAWVYMNAFFADHPGTNYLTAQGDWILDGGSNPDTTTVDYSLSIGAGGCVTVCDSVSWDIAIPSTDEPYNWWSLWAYGEVGVELAPVPEPATMSLVGLALTGMLLARRRRRL
jgi:hypothetical protein